MNSSLNGYPVDLDLPALSTSTFLPCRIVDFVFLKKNCSLIKDIIDKGKYISICAEDITAEHAAAGGTSVYIYRNVS